MSDRRPTVPPTAQPGAASAASAAVPAPHAPPSPPSAAAEVEGQGFLSRWSRRKSLVREGQPVAPEPRLAAVSAQAVRSASAAEAARALPPPGSTPLECAAPWPAADASAASAREAPLPEAPAPSPPPPTLEDVERLTPGSDFSRFTGRDVDPQVRNAAMRKLFHSEPQFNVMDGLDVYIDDYNTPDPLPKAIMRTMLQARALGLLDDELKEQDAPPHEPAAGCAQEVSPAADPTEAPAAQPDSDGGALDDNLAVASAQPMAAPVPEADAATTAPAEPHTAHEDPDLQLQPHHAPGHSRPDAAAEHPGGGRGDG